MNILPIHSTNQGENHAHCPIRPFITSSRPLRPTDDTSNRPLRPRATCRNPPLPYGFNFEKIDADGDGQITRTEWNNFIDGNPNLSDSQKQTLKDSFDMYARSDGEAGDLERAGGRNPTISASDFKREKENIGAIIDPKNHPEHEQYRSIRNAKEDVDSWHENRKPVYI